METETANNFYVNEVGAAQIESMPRPCQYSTVILYSNERLTIVSLCTA